MPHRKRFWHFFSFGLLCSLLAFLKCCRYSYRWLLKSSKHTRAQVIKSDFCSWCCWTWLKYSSGQRWEVKLSASLSAHFQLKCLSLRIIFLIDMQPTLCFPLQVNRGLFSNTKTTKTSLGMANPCLESVKPSAVWHSHSLMLSLPPNLVAWRLYPRRQNIGSSNILIPFWKLIFPYGSCSCVFYVAMTRRLMLLELK